MSQVYLRYILGNILEVVTEAYWDLLGLLEVRSSPALRTPVKVDMDTPGTVQCLAGRDRHGGGRAWWAH